MRELKFRAWDKENNFMFYYGNNYPLSKYYLGFNHRNHNKMSLMILVDPSDSEFKEIEADIMQYTGLKDCKGREIYEGDILSYKHIVYTDCSKTEIEKIEEEALIEIITYAPIASIIKPYSKNVKCNGYDRTNNQCLIIDLSSDEVEVIGNIYENKELLEM